VTTAPHPQMFLVEHGYTGSLNIKQMANGEFMCTIYTSLFWI
jgi:hypothetical protein